VGGRDVRGAPPPLELDGHDGDALVETIAHLDTTAGAPHVLVARTVFGKGVSYMERQIKWHYSPMSDDEYRRALAEVAEQERSACEARSSAR